MQGFIFSDAAKCGPELAPPPPLWGVPAFARRSALRRGCSPSTKEGGGGRFSTTRGRAGRETPGREVGIGGHGSSSGRPRGRRGLPFPKTPFAARFPFFHHGSGPRGSPPESPLSLKGLVPAQEVRAPAARPSSAGAAPVIDSEDYNIASPGCRLPPRDALARHPLQSRFAGVISRPLPTALPPSSSPVRFDPLPPAGGAVGGAQRQLSRGPTTGPVSEAPHQGWRRELRGSGGYHPRPRPPGTSALTAESGGVPLPGNRRMNCRRK